MNIFQIFYRSCFVLVAVAIAVLFAANSRAAENETSASGKLGSLACKQISGTGINLLIFSRYEVRCVFTDGSSIKQ